MLNRIIRIAAALACYSLLQGCSMQLDRPAEPEAIDFSAGQSLLREDATKSDLLKDDFLEDDFFFVYGSKTISSSHRTVFRGDAVSVDGSNHWDYAPHRFWDFSSERYDFLAFSGPSTSSTISCNPAAEGALSALVSYDPVDAQYDLMAACKRRIVTSGQTDPVDLLFYHMLSAVSVTIINDSPAAVPITLNSYKFQNLCTQGTATVSQNDDTPVIPGVWNDMSYNTNLVLGHDFGGNVIVNGGGTRVPSPKTDLMIPQEFGLSLTYIPRLVLDYSYKEAPDAEPTRVVTGIRLEEIKAVADDQYIVKWLPGVRYTYEVHIRMGGGLRVSVTVAPWEEIHAETPGVTIK